ncbi:L-asparaginase 1 [Clostridium homopropionicum DSM 5847]|uniref:asparaginase n=1 Tax=Clostridium homopropionicum DSM 5847 TaxID=1121318 RepID=A0A0L6Z8M7_9CLOT|nr:asparaginase [Clostridium homopropionicum]KOA19314.1 L-asparaginase 1 [Clostridium homopropionicum DSM 5847]SFG20771.1 asparaginase [Clostridium homopropionicum]
MKNILLLTTGGTIACVETDKGLSPRLDGQWLINKIPEIKTLCNVSVKQVLNIDSSNISSADWTLISNAIYEGIQKYDGIVITHGTDTMAYTTSIISYVLQNLNKPVVFTGSQVPITHELSDGTKNLLDAFKVATSQLKGVCLVFNGKIIRGTRAIKIHSSNTDAFVSCNDSYLGKIISGKVYLENIEKIEKNTIEFYPNICDKVFLLKLTPGISDSIVDYIISQSYKGVVIEAFGLGGIPSKYNDLLEKLQNMTSKHKIPVIVVSQCVYDGTDLNVYNVGVKALESGLISGKDMTTEATVTKLMWALGQTSVYKEIKKIMHKNICGEINAAIS